LGIDLIWESFFRIRIHVAGAGHGMYTHPLSEFILMILIWSVQVTRQTHVVRASWPTKDRAGRLKIITPGVPVCSKTALRLIDFWTVCLLPVHVPVIGAASILRLDTDKHHDRSRRGSKIKIRLVKLKKK